MASTLKVPEQGWPLSPLAAHFSVSLDETAALALGKWLDTMVEWNARMDLTAARNEGELLDLMVADALMLSSRVPRGATVLDVGTGAGAPGLALAALRPDLKVTLVEPLTKRVAFLRTAASLMGRTDVQIERSKVEPLLESGRTWDVVMARATFAPPSWLACGTKLAPEGSTWVLLAKEDAPSLTGYAVAEDVEYEWPLQGARRRAVRYARG